MTTLGIAIAGVVLALSSYCDYLRSSRNDWRAKYHEEVRYRNRLIDQLNKDRA